jgi:hypothetical protein
MSSIKGQLMNITGFPRAVQVCLSPRLFGAHKFGGYLTRQSRGEKTASALESRLTDIESRIDQLLANIEEKERDDHDSLADGPTDRQSVVISRK